MRLRSTVLVVLCAAGAALAAPDAGPGSSITEGEVAGATGTKLQLRTGKDARSTFALGPETSYAGPGLRTWGDLKTGRWVRVTWSGVDAHRRAVHVEAMSWPAPRGTTVPDERLLPGAVQPGPALPPAREANTPPVGTGSETPAPVRQDEKPGTLSPAPEVPPGTQPPRPEPH